MIFSKNKKSEEDDYDEEDEKDDILPDPKTSIWLLLLIFVVAMAVRLYVIFHVTDPQNAGVEWYNDTYHHWQIAYLYKTVGIGHGFFRMWDLKGMDYFWGILHPMVLAGLFGLFGTVDILVLRILTAVGGSLVIVFIFLLVRRYFNLQVALSTVLIAIFFPVILFSDSVGMQEQLGLPMLLLGMWLWPRRPIISGSLWALSGMVRAEYWLMGFGLVLASFFLEKKFDRKILLLTGWLFVSFFYMSILKRYTGNPIYPIWWNYVGNASGEWMTHNELTSIQKIMKFWSEIAFFIISTGILLVFWKKPRSWPLLLFGLGNMLILAYLWGFSEYIQGFISRHFYDRFFYVPYLFLGMFLSVLIFQIIGRKLRLFRRLYLGWIILILGLVFSQEIWQPIKSWYAYGFRKKADYEAIAKEIAVQDNGQGRILIQEDIPYMTYYLVRNFGVTGPRIEGEKYTAFAYLLPEDLEDPFKNWGKNRRFVLGWFLEKDIRLISNPGRRDMFVKLAAREPEIFQTILTSDVQIIYWVDIKKIKEILAQPDLK